MLGRKRETTVCDQSYPLQRKGSSSAWRKVGNWEVGHCRECRRGSKRCHRECLIAWKRCFWIQLTCTIVSFPLQFKRFYCICVEAWILEEGSIVHFALDFNPQYTKFPFFYVSLHDNSFVFLLKICRIEMQKKCPHMFFLNTYK